MGRPNPITKVAKILSKFLPSNDFLYFFIGFLLRSIHLYAMSNFLSTSNPQLRLLRFNGLGFDQISYADGGN